MCLFIVLAFRLGVGLVERCSSVVVDRHSINQGKSGLYTIVTIPFPIFTQLYKCLPGGNMLMTIFAL